MTIWIIGAVLSGLSSILCFVYAAFTIRGKGPVFSYAWLFAASIEKQELYRRKNYMNLTIISICMGTALLLTTIGITASVPILNWVSTFLGGIAGIYAFIVSFKAPV